MASNLGIISNIQKFSIHDGPGIRTTVFFKGCPLRCKWCHNPETQLTDRELILWPGRCISCGACLVSCEQSAISSDAGVIQTDRTKCIVCGDCVEKCYAQSREIVGREMSVEEVMEEIERDRLFYDESGGGVTFSGGEPMFQPDFLEALVRKCKEKEIHNALDTCGFALWENFDRIRDYVDLFLYDLKQMDDIQHQELTGVSNQLILDNLRKLSERGHNLILRVPIISGINDNQEQVRQIGEFAITLPHLIRLDLLPYHQIAMEKYQRLDKVYLLRETHPPTVEGVNEIAQVLRSYNLPVKIGG